MNTTSTPIRVNLIVLTATTFGLLSAWLFNAEQIPYSDVIALAVVSIGLSIGLWLKQPEKNYRQEAIRAVGAMAAMIVSYLLIGLAPLMLAGLAAGVHYYVTPVFVLAGYCIALKYIYDLKHTLTAGWITAVLMVSAGLIVFYTEIGNGLEKTLLWFLLFAPMLILPLVTRRKKKEEERKTAGPKLTLKEAGICLAITVVALLLKWLLLLVELDGMVLLIVYYSVIALGVSAGLYVRSPMKMMSWHVSRFFGAAVVLSGSAWLYIYGIKAFSLTGEWVYYVFPYAILMVFFIAVALMYRLGSVLRAVTAVFLLFYLYHIVAAAVDPFFRGISYSGYVLLFLTVFVFPVLVHFKR
jgi:hypothetical protein